jgi:hypothetical protein
MLGRKQRPMMAFEIKQLILGMRIIKNERYLVCL